MKSPDPNRRLELSPEEMRTLGYQVIDLLVDHYQTINQKPVKAYGSSSREAMEQQFREPIPLHGMDPDELLEMVQRDILEQNYHRMHPRDFAYVTAPGNFIGVLADTLAAGYNIFGGAWISSPSGAMIELVTIDWLRQLMGMPESTGGIFTTGGSIANLTGLAVARHIKLGHDMQNSTIYLSDQTHASVPKALRTLGFGDDNICTIEVDENFRINLDRLIQQITDDRAQGKNPFCIVANAGTTNTGAVDPLSELAAICKQENLWYHIDGAYGAAAAFTEKGKVALCGIELADSLAIDPHKWLFQPYDIGCTLIRDRRHLWETFNVAAEYLKNLVDPTLQEVNFYDYGLQMSRSFRALKLWMTIKAFGFEAMQAAIEHGIILAESIEQELRKSPKWQIITPAHLGIITFRYHKEGLSNLALDDLNERISQQIIQDGFAFIATTTLRGQSVLRMVTINPRTTHDDIVQTIRRMEAFGEAG